MKTQFLSLISLFALQYSSAQMVQQLPKDTRDNYSKFTDESISDEFNGKSLDLKKWGRRNTGGAMIEKYHADSSLVSIESIKENGEQVSYLSIKGIGEDGTIRTTGVVTRASGFYGFYVVKFRYRGFDTPELKQNGTIWHPSVWGALADNVDGNENRTTTKSKFWTEIDFMEWDGESWSSDAPARLVDSKGISRKVITQTKGLEKGIMRKEVIRFDDGWQTIGLEYAPDHLKLWEWKDGKWIHMGDRVVQFVEDDPVTPESKYTIETIGKAARQPLFWILGNVVSRHLYDSIEKGTNKKTHTNMFVDFDYFRYYRHKSAENIDWPWEHQKPNGGK